MLLQLRLYELGRQVHVGHVDCSVDPLTSAARQRMRRGNDHLFLDAQLEPEQGFRRLALDSQQLPELRVDFDLSRRLTGTKLGRELLRAHALSTEFGRRNVEQAGFACSTRGERE